MAEVLHVDEAAKVRVFGPPEWLIDTAVPPDAMSGRVAPDELLILGPPGTAPHMVQELELALAVHGPRGLVVDHTDGWSCFALVGDDAWQVFSRVSQIPPPAAAGDAPVFLMGRVCDVAGKVFVRPGRIEILTGAEASDHVRHRLEEAAAQVARPRTAVG